MIACGKQCVDCGDVRDYYMVNDRVWKKAGLNPRQCCCRKCLAPRLGRPLAPADFTPCPVNDWIELSDPIDANLQADIDKAFTGTPEGLQKAFEDWSRQIYGRGTQAPKRAAPRRDFTPRGCF
jgi:hypothetical protein